MRRWLAVILVLACAAMAAPRSRNRMWMRFWDRGTFMLAKAASVFTPSPLPAPLLEEFAPPDGGGLPATPCTCPASVSMTLADGGLNAASIVNNPTGGLCPLPDSQSYVSCPANTARITTGSPAETVMGVLFEPLRSNFLRHSRHADQPDAGTGFVIWASNGVSCVPYAGGMLDSGVAARCTVTVDGGTISQTVALGGSYYVAGTTHLKLVSGDGGLGNFKISIDCTNWYDIALWNGWARAVPSTKTVGCSPSGPECTVVEDLYATATSTVCLGVMGMQAGSVFDMDLSQVEASGVPFQTPTSPIDTAAAAFVTRQQDIIRFTTPDVFSVFNLVMRARIVGGLGQENGTVMFLGAVSATDTSTLNTARMWTGPQLPEGAISCAQGDSAGGIANTSTDGISSEAFTVCTFTDAGVSGQSAGTVLGFTAITAGRTTTGGDKFLQFGGYAGSTNFAASVISEAGLDYASSYPDGGPPVVFDCGPTDIVWLGDSLCVGLTSAGIYSPPGSLENTTRRRVWNGCVGAAAVTVGSWRIGDTYAKYASKGYNTLVYGGGTNDLSSSVSGATLATATQSLLSDALAQGHSLVVVGVLPRGGSAGWTLAMETERVAYNTAMQTWCALVGAVYVDPSSMGTGASPIDALKAQYAAPDSLHLTRAGARALAALVKPRLP